MKQKLANLWQASAFLRFAILSLCSALLLTVALGIFHPSMTAVGQTEHRSGPVELPWTFEEAGTDKILTITLEHRFGVPTRWQVTTDDHLYALTINEQQFSFADIPPLALEDYPKGLVIDLAPYLRAGSNTLVFTVGNVTGGPGGLSFRPYYGLFRWALIGAGFLPLVIGLAGLFRLSATQTLAIALSLVLLCCYWSVTPWQLRTHDTAGWSGHIGYVQYVAYKLALPAPNAGWTFYHPPLYYMLGAVVWRWASFAGLPGPESLQAFSLALWFVFVTSAAGALRITLRSSPGVVLLATAALAFWPAGIIHSIRIGNDAAFYAASGVACWFTALWWKTRRRDHLLGMAASVAVALLCKSNAILLVGICGLLVLLHAVRRRNRAAVVSLGLYSGITLLGVATSFAVRTYYYLQGRIPSWLIANGNSLSENLRVPNEIKSFLPLDVPTFLVTPFISPWHDDTGRANFWNYLLKTGLFGEMTFTGRVQEYMALAMSSLLLALIFVALAYRQHALTSRAAWRYLPWSLSAFVWLTGLMLLRIDLPFACSNDARYILPILIPALIWWGLAGRASRTLMGLLVVCSVVFFVSL